MDFYFLGKLTSADSQQLQEVLPLPSKGNNLYCQNSLEKVLSGRKSCRTQQGIETILGERAKLIGCTSERKGHYRGEM